MTKLAKVVDGTHNRPPNSLKEEAGECLRETLLLVEKLISSKVGLRS